ncbi:MAG: HutD/Ves family protein [Wohlfahrtiimonas sp.]
MKKIIFNDLKEMPWKNGQGTTRQIAIHPENADISNFHWRISAASVNTVGPFSNFDNVTRSLALLTGNKITLNIQGQSVELHRDGQPVTFSGEVPTEMTDCPAPALDFGVMANNQYAKHSLVHADFNDGQTYQRKSPITLVLALKPCQLDKTQLDTFDAILLNENDPNCITIQTQTRTAPLLIAEISEYCPSELS